MPHKQICPHCKKEIKGQVVQQGGLHYGCFNIEIGVWLISLPDAPKSGYYENDVRNISEMLKDAEDAYLIERQQMVAGQFHNLPDFEGF